MSKKELRARKADEKLARKARKKSAEQDTRSKYTKIRKKRRPLFNLKIRLTFLVAFEMLASILIAYIVHFIVNGVFFRLLNHFLFSKFLSFEISIPFALILIPICLLVGITFTFAVSIWFFRPIRKLSKAIGRVADGDFSVRMSTKTTSREIQEVYSGFNLMAEELQATEILQTDFVSNVSHEFKTPINAIEGYSMLLQDTENLSEEQQEYVEKILFNTKRLSTLTGSILLLSKIENQTISTDKVNFNIDEQIRQTIVALEPLWGPKNVEFDVEMEGAEYFGSEKLLYHVWTNIIGNAIKFGPDGGIVKITLDRFTEKRRSFIRVTVEDDGEGLSEEALKHIFDKFYQADNSHKAEGNGLGLTLVKKIVALEEGSVRAENRDYGGCRFIVTLPEKASK